MNEQAKQFLLNTKYNLQWMQSMFIQFAEEHFTDYTADHLHNPTVKSCLLRIPGSPNTKCNPSKDQYAEVKTIERWDTVVLCSILFGNLTHTQHIDLLQRLESRK